MAISGDIFRINEVYELKQESRWPTSAPTIQRAHSIVSSMNEGISITVTVNTFDYDAGETLYWTIEGVSGTINESDFSATSGSFVIQANNFGHFTITTTNDELTEGVESFKVQIRTGSTSGEIKTETTPITINDTSLSEIGWFVGGERTNYTLGSNSRVERITFSSDTETASVRGNLSFGTGSGGGVGNVNYGWHSTGATNNSKIQRITYSNDTATSSQRGNLSLTRKFHTAVDNDTYGWFAGGLLFGTSVPETSTIDRMSFSSDTSTNSVRGPLTGNAFQRLSATGNGSYGWFGYGRSPSGTTTGVQRIQYSSDSTSALSRGPNVNREAEKSATGNDTYGWFAGGSTDRSPIVDGGRVSSIRRLTYSNDTVEPSVRSNLVRGRPRTAALGNDSYGWFGGGQTSEGNFETSLIERITFSNDTSNASTRGPLSEIKREMTSSSGRG